MPDSYEFRVITDWTQPEQAVSKYVAEVQAAITRIQSQISTGQVRGGTPAAAALQGELRGLGGAAQASYILGQKAGVDPAVLARLTASQTAAGNVYSQLAKEGQTSVQALAQYNTAVAAAGPAMARNAQRRAEVEAVAAAKTAEAATVAAEKSDAAAAKAAQIKTDAAVKAGATEQAAAEKAGAKILREFDKVGQDFIKLDASIAKLEAAAARKLNAAANATPDAQRAAALKRKSEQLERNRFLAQESVDPSSNLSPLRRDAAIASSVARRQSRLDVAGARQAELETVAAEAMTLRVATEKERIAIAQKALGREIRILTLDDNMAALQAERILIEKELVLAERKETQEAVKRAVAGGTFGKGTPGQRVQAYLASRRTGEVHLPEEFARGGQVFGGGLLTTAKFFASSAVLYGLVSGVRDSVKQAIGLQKELFIIRGQLADLGDVGGSSFEDIRSGILETAQATATAADVVANVTRQLAGAFADKGTGRPDYTRAAEEAKSAFELAQVTGLPTQQITDDLTAVALAFDVNFRDISDIILGLETEFGVLSPEIVRFTADLAPLGSQLGFTAEQLAALGAAAQQASGKPGSALSEQLGRILPALQEKQAQVITLLGQNAQTSSLIEETAAAFGRGDIPAVLINIVKASQQFTKTQNDQLASIVGTRREAGTFYALLDNAVTTLRALGAETGDYTGTLEKRFAAVQKTVSFQFGQLRRTLEQFGIQLFNSGLGQGLSEIAKSLTLVASAAVGVLRILSGFNDILGGLPGKILLMVTALKALAVAQALVSRLNIGTALAGAFGGSSTAADVTTASAAGAGRFAGAAAGIRSLFSKVPPILVAALAAILANKVLGYREATREAEANFDEQVKQQLDAGVSIEKLRQQVASTDYELSTGERVREGLRRGFTLDTNPVRDSMQRLNLAYAETRKERYKAIADFLIERGAEELKGLDLGDYNTQTVLDDAIANLKAGRGYRFTRKSPPKIFGGRGGIFEYGTVVGDLITASKGDIENLLSGLDDLDAVAKVASQVGSGDLQQSVEAAVLNYEAGRTSIDTLIKTLRNQESVLRNAFDVAERLGVDSSAFASALQDIVALVREKGLEAIQSQRDVSDALADLVGGDVVGASVESARLAAQRVVHTPEATPQDRFEAARELARAQREEFQAYIDDAEDAGEALRRAREGYRVDDLVRKAYIEAQLSSGPNAGLIEKVAEDIGRAVDTINQAISFGIVNMEQDAATVLKTLIVGRINIATAAYINLLKLKKFLDSPLFGNAGEGLDALLAAYRDQLTILYGDLAEVDAASFAVTDPATGGLSNQDVKKYADDAAKQREEEVKAAQEAERARLELLQAQAEAAGDPIRAAEIGLQLADLEIAQATDDAARYRAMANKVRAQQALLDAKNTVMTAWNDLAKAMHEAAGDTVAVAQDELDRINALLADARARGDSLAILQLTAQQIRAQAGVRDASLQRQEDDIDFALQMERITVGQAIERFRALLQIPGITQKETEAILLKIKELQGSLGQDYRFNLPDFILPTQYEVKRANQAGGIGNYNDNRVITIEINANNSMEAEQALQVVTEALAAPSRVGNRPRIY